MQTRQSFAKKTISVIIPTFNRADLLIEALESVLAQTCRDFELIVVDDGSTDETIDRIREYRDRLIYLPQRNQGVSAARNHGIRAAHGKWIAFLDSDDLWLPDKLKIQLEFFAANPSAKICQTEEIWIRCGKRVNPMKKHQKYSGWIFEQCLALCIVSPSAVMIERDLFNRVGLFDEELPACEDYDLWLRISKNYPISLIDRPLIYKRGGHNDQLSRKYWGMDRFRVQSMLKLLTTNDLSPLQRKRVINELHRKCDVLIGGFLKRDKAAEALFYQNIKGEYAN